jgi:hypothetical protein
MEKTWTKALRDSISEVFATMFFLVPEEDPSLAQSLAANQAIGWLESWLEVVHQEETAKVWVWAPPELAIELAANILSLEQDDISAEDMLDAFKEMLNMVVGRLLTIVDTSSEWRMGLPNARHLEKGTLGEATSQAQWIISYDIEEKPLLAGCCSQQA